MLSKILCRNFSTSSLLKDFQAAFIFHSSQLEITELFTPPCFVFFWKSRSAHRSQTKYLWKSGSCNYWQLKRDHPLIQSEDLACCPGEGELPYVGYVPLTRVDFSLPKIQDRPQILKFYSRTGPTFWSFIPEQDPFLTIWSQTPGSNVKIPVAFSFCFLQPDVFTFVLLYLSKCSKLSITGISLSQDIWIPLWI